jgi:hypothetical protein
VIAEAIPGRGPAASDSIEAADDGAIQLASTDNPMWQESTRFDRGSSGCAW